MTLKDRLKNVEMTLNQLESVKKVLIVFKHDKLIPDKNKQSLPVVAICGTLVTVGGETVVVGTRFEPGQALRLF